jgi:phytoene synthase
MVAQPLPFAASEAAHRYVLDEVRLADRDRFLAALFAPEPQRRGLLAVLAFDHELGRTRTVTREPMLARIRLEWWREAVGEAVGTGKPRAQPVVESLSETVRRHGLPRQRLLALIDAREEEVEGALDVVRAGHALADLQLDVLGVGDAATRNAARAVASAGLMGEGPERAALLAEARALRPQVDPAALPILLPARLLDRRWAPWQKPLVLWWSARRGRY